MATGPPPLLIGANRVSVDEALAGTSSTTTFAPAAVRETHSAVVFLVGDRAYKMRKPVNRGFLDFSTRDAREPICHREVELNRRFAPDVYLGVADVLGPDGTVGDHLVVMRRMPEDRRLATLVATGAPVEDGLRSLAHVATILQAAASTQAACEAAAATRWRPAGRTTSRPLRASRTGSSTQTRLTELQRVDRRLAEGSDAPDATSSVIQAMAASESPWPPAATISTTTTPAEAINAAIAVVESGM